MIKILNQHEIQIVSGGNAYQIGILATQVECNEKLKIIGCMALVGAIEYGFYGHVDTNPFTGETTTIATGMDGVMKGALKYGIGTFIGFNINSLLQRFRSHLGYKS